MDKNRKLSEALTILTSLGLPRAQQNERSALCLLALSGMTPEKNWQQAEAPCIGITPLMDWARTHYQKNYAPNTRETVRRQSMHQLVAAGIAAYNPDAPQRAVNSPKAVYQLTPEALALLRVFGTTQWKNALQTFLESTKSLSERYAQERTMQQLALVLADGKALQLSPGAHSALIKAVIEDFAPRFTPGCALVYAGDTGDKWGYFDEQLLCDLGVLVDAHGKMPDVVLHYSQKNWLVLVEAVTSHGPVDGKRHEELAQIFAGSKAGIVYVTAFPTRSTMARYLGTIAWETEVWVADSPTHLIHFNGERFLGPYG